MNQPKGYLYEIEDHRYLLVPDVQVSKTRTYLTGVGIHDLKGNYLGYWDRFNMPMEVVRSITKWYKNEHWFEIAERRTAMFRKERKPNI